MYIRQAHKIFIMFIFLLSSFILIVEFACAKSTENNDKIIYLKETFQNFSIDNYLFYLEDKKGELSLSDISSENELINFQANTNNYINFGFSSSVYWFKFTVSFPKNSECQWFLEINYPQLDYLELFTKKSDGSYSSFTTGDRYKFEKRQINNRNFIFLLEKNNELTQTYYLKIKSSGSLNIPISIYSGKELIEKINYEQMIIGLYYGSMLVMLLYNLFLFISFKESSYLYYIMYVFSYLILQSIFNGLAYEYLWPSCIWWANNSLVLFSMLSLFFLIQFSRSFLKSPRYAVFCDQLLRIYILIITCSLILCLFIPYRYMIQFNTMIAIIVAITLIATGLTSYNNGFLSARYYNIAWSVFLLGIAIYGIKNFGIFSHNLITHHLPQFGSTIGVLIFSLGLSDRINRELQAQVMIQKQTILERQEALCAKQDALNALEQIAYTLEDKSEKLVSVASQLEENSEKMADQTNQVASSSVEMTANITNIASSIEKMSDEIKTVSVTTEQMSENINSVAGAIEEMSASINKVGENASQGSIIAEKATRMANEAAITMTSLGDAANEIGKVTDVIKRIADKTNLLALNAAIEAASAGEAGKGFAVVASSIQKFADQSTEAAEDIITRIVSVQLNTEEAVKAIADVSNIIKEINYSSETISVAMQEQTNASNDIVKNVSQANIRANDIAISMSELAKVGDEISGSAVEVAKGFDHVTGKIKSVNTTAEESNANVRQVHLSASELANIAGELRSGNKMP